MNWRLLTLHLMKACAREIQRLLSKKVPKKCPKYCYYKVASSGRWVLLSHETWFLFRGWIRHHGHWFGFDRALADQLNARGTANSHTVHALDLLGNGDYLHCASPKTISKQAAFIESRIQDLDSGGDIYVIALSLASLVVMQALISGPAPDISITAKSEKEKRCWRERVKGIVLINPSARGESYFWQRLRPRVWPAVVKYVLCFNPWLLEADLVKLTINNQSIRVPVLACNRKLLDTFPISRVNALNQLVSASRFSIKHFPAHSPSPLLVLSAKEDRLVSWSCGAKLAKRMGGDFGLHPSAGHDLTTDDPAWVLDQINAWRQSLRVPEQSRDKPL